jgi:hypothetical protein
MDPELKQWAETWHSAPRNGGELVRRAQSAHRKEAASQAFGVAGVVLAYALTARALLTGGLELSTTAGKWGAAWSVFACLLGALSLAVSFQQVARARRASLAAPTDWIDDLIRLRERESYWWTGRFPVLTTATLALGSLLTGAAVYAPGAFPWGDPRSAGTPWPLMFTVVALALVAAVGVVQVRQLRRELPRLRQLRRELDE